MDVLIVTGDRDALQLVDDEITVLMTRRGHQRHDPLHPGGGAGQVRPDARRSTRTSRRCAAIRATTCRRSRAWGRRPRRSGSRSSARSTSWSTGSTRCPARPVTRCANIWRRSMRNRQLTELLRTSNCRWARTICGSGSWDREAVHQLFDTLQFRVLRERLYATLSAVEPEADQGFDVDVEALGRRRGRRSGWPSMPQTGERPGCRFAAPGAAAPGRPASRSPPRRRGGAGSTRPGSAPRTSGAGRLARRPDQPKAVHDVKGPLLALPPTG